MFDFDEFATQVRLNRGKLSNYDEELATIYFKGVPGLREFTLDKKIMGIKNISVIAGKSIRFQERFLSFMADKDWKATKDEIELWFLDATQNEEHLKG